MPPQLLNVVTVADQDIARTELTREKSCPACRLKCGKCDRIGHFRTVCKSTKPRKPGKGGSVSEVAEEATDQGFASSQQVTASMFNISGSQGGSVSFAELAALCEQDQQGGGECWQWGEGPTHAV